MGEVIILAPPDPGTTALFVAAVVGGAAALGVAVRELWRSGRVRRESTNEKEQP